MSLYVLNTFLRTCSSASKSQTTLKLAHFLLLTCGSLHNYIFLTSSRKLKNYHKLLLHKHDDTNSIKVAEILKFSA